MRLSSGMSGQVPAVEPIYPNPVITPEMAAAMYAATGRDGLSGPRGGNMAGLGCTDPLICWGSAWGGAPTRGADVDYAVVGLNGAMGDWQRARFTVPENPIVPGLAGLGCPGVSCGNRGVGNGIVNGLRGLRGLGAFDTSSASAFVTSIKSGSSTDPIFGVTLPNWAWLGGGVLLLAALTQKARGRR